MQEKPRKPRGHPPRKEVHDQVLQLIANLISRGHSDRVVKRITCVRSDIWKRFAREGRKIEVRSGGSTKRMLWQTVLENAERARNGSLALKLIDSMHEGIAKQNVYCMKVAIHNFDTGLKDPDYVIPVKIQRKLEKLKAMEGSDDDYTEAVEADPEVVGQVAIELPPGATPTVGIAGPIQDSSSGQAVGQNGTGKT